MSAAHNLTYALPALAGACITASYALLRGRGTRVARAYAIDSSVNCAIAGATFFSARNANSFLEKCANATYRRERLLDRTPLKNA